MDWYEEYEREQQDLADQSGKLFVAAIPVVTIFVVAVYVFNVIKAALF